MIQINANLFARVAVAQSTELVRYYLQGVCIQPAGATGKGVTLVATDGHMLIAGNDPKADAASLLPSGGIIVSWSVLVIRRMSSLSAALPGTITAPKSPP